MSEIVITGASGVVGRRVVRQLLDDGHHVRGVVRSADARHRLERLGARTVAADVYDRAALRDAFEGADAVVNLLTRIPRAHEMARPGAWDENDRLRREASAAVARAAQDVGAQRLVQESLSFVYADGGDAWLDEDAPVEGAGAPASALAAEANARERFGGETVVLRFGLFIGGDSHLTLATLEAARTGLSPTYGPREAYVPTVWLDDAASAVVAALRAPAGTYNVNDDEPPTRAEIDAAVAAAVGVGALRPMATPPGMEPLARSQRLSNRRLREATGWAPRVRGGIDGWSLIEPERLAA